MLEYESNLKTCPPWLVHT